MMMRIVKPINWNYIEDIRHGDWRLMKGDFGECIVREFLEGKGFGLERLERRARGLPDFKITGLPVMEEEPRPPNVSIEASRLAEEELHTPEKAGLEDSDCPSPDTDWRRGAMHRLHRHRMVRLR